MPTFTRPDASIPAWSELGDAVRPENEDIQVGWPPSDVPPARQEFNWIDKRQDEAFKYLCRVGIAEYDQNEQYQGFGLCLGANGSIYWNRQSCVGVDPVFDAGTFWEKTLVRLTDGDARYLRRTESGSWLTQAQADQRYMLKTGTGDFLTIQQGDVRYQLKSAMTSYPTFTQGDSRWATSAQLSVYLPTATAHNTFLTKVDAANIYATKASINVTGVSLDVLNSRLAALQTTLQNFTTDRVNNQNTTIRAWVQNLLPGVTATYYNYSGGAGSWNCEWLVADFRPNNGRQWRLCFGMGGCQQGDTITVPPGFDRTNVRFRGWVTSAMGQFTAGTALLNIRCSFSLNTCAECFFAKANDNNTPRARGYAIGSFVAIGWNLNVL